MRKALLLVLLVVCITPVFADSITGMGIMDTIKKLFTPESFDLLSGGGALNCSVLSSCAGNQTSVLKLFNLSNSHAALPNQSWGNYSVCCEDLTGSYNISADNGTVFLRLYQENNSHVELPNLTNYNVSAFISAGDNVSIVCDYVSTYGDCTANITNGTNLSNATCLVTLPNLYNGTNLHVADCVSNPYEVSVCCAFGGDLYELVVMVDGNITDNMTNAGEPYNVTVIVKKNGVLAGGVDVWAEECNGIDHFALIQSVDSNYTNCAYSKVKTDPGGNVSYTNVPTGGEPLYSAPFNYTVNFYVVVDGEIKATVPFTVINRAPPDGFPRGNITQNKPNVEGTNERILVVFDRVSRSRIVNDIAGENYDIVVYDNGTVVGGDVNLSSGQPSGLNVTVINSTSLTGIPDSIIRMREDSGLMHWGLIQYTQAFASTNVSNHVVGTVNTGVNGNVLFTVVPTAGFPIATVEQSIGPYSVNMTVALPDGSVIVNHEFVIDRDLPAPNPNVVVYNKGEVEGFNEKILVLFDRIVKYIQ